MTREEADSFALRWAGWWNTGAIESVLERFSPDIVFTSPRAVEVVGSATVRGKDALRAYWTAALKRVGSVHFVVDHTVWDPVRRELAIIYTSTIAGKTTRASENLTLDDNDEVVSAEVFHGVTGQA